MSQKDKEKYLTKAVKKTKRQINGYKVIVGPSPTDKTTKVSVTRVWPPKEEIILRWTSDTVSLPTKDKPFVVLQLTQAQIDAIPKDQYVVAVIGPAKPAFVVAPGTGEQLFITFITHLDALKKDGNDLFTLIRNYTRDGGGGMPPENEMFLPPIDDNKMSDCIMRVILHFFGDNDKIKLHGHEYKLSEFCVLIHYYFLRINVLKKKGRQPFCNYLEGKVFHNKLKFTPKTFNNYAAEHKNEKLTDTKELPINFSFPSNEKERPFQRAFHDVGHIFHNSSYFAELRQMKENVKIFLI